MREVGRGCDGQVQRAMSVCVSPSCCGPGRECLFPLSPCHANCFVRLQAQGGGVHLPCRLGGRKSFAVTAQRLAGLG